MKKIKTVPDNIRDFLPGNSWSKIVLNNNKDVGKGYEKLSARLFIDSLKDKMDISKFTILIDKKCFHCFTGNTTIRRFDIFIEELLVGFEIKSSRVVNNKFVRNQIQKDKWLLQNRVVNEVRWVLFNGASQNVLQSLTQNKIMYLNIIETGNNFTNIMQIYHEVNGEVLTSEGISVIPL
jgi:hypothetical protein